MIELQLRRMKVAVNVLTAPMYYNSWRAEIRLMIDPRWMFEVNHHWFERILEKHTIFKHRSLALVKCVTAARCSMVAMVDRTAYPVTRTPYRNMRLSRSSESPLSTDDPPRLHTTIINSPTQKCRLYICLLASSDYLMPWRKFRLSTAY